MSIETAEKYLQELEAIKNYAEVKREKEELSQKLEELNISLDNALKGVSSLKSLKVNLSGVNMTLEEARRHFIQAKEAEIKKRLAEKFEKLKADYNSKMAEFVYQRLRDILGQSWWPEEIANLLNIEAKKKANAILRNQDSWPPWFKESYQQEVKKKVSAGLNREFNTRVETAAIATAQQRLNELAGTEWPAWYQANVDPKLAQLEREAIANSLQLLAGPWTFICDRCGTRFDDELTASGVERLLRNGTVSIECTNPECEDHSLFSTRRHTFRVSLCDLIEIHIMG